ncbi:MAG: 23S rRNA (guanosine(2251)-2'-O)-methyltransferase RlmB [Flavobacteriales bacterium]|nr:23S rRNA (guanosine(2251)-2'-O)-methyltransferase RlmB [Flavobacteriales bacterium]
MDEEKRISKTDYIYGMHPVMEAIKAQKTIDKVLVQSDLKGPNITELRRLLKDHKISSQNLPLGRLNHLYKKNHQGVVALLSPIEFQPYEEVLNKVYEEGRTPLFLILDRVSDVGNFGAICRSAECLGVDHIIIPVKGSAQINDEAIKRSSGALLNISVSRERDLAEVCQKLAASGLQLIGCSEKGEKNIYEVKYELPLAIVMGSERDGINSTIVKELNDMVQIPMSGKTDSLNVAASTAIILSEISRQRGGF